MKKLFTLVAALLLAATVWAQSCPQKISYQAVVRNNANQLVVGTSGIQVTVTIKEGTTTKYVETHNVTSNQNGLISLTVGEGTHSEFYPTMENIDWSNATMVTTVTVPGEAPVEASTPVTAVPYALYSCEINPGSITITNIYKHIGDTLNNYYTKNKTKIHIASAIHDSIVNNISTQIHDTVMKHLTEYEIQDCEDVKNCVAPQIKDSLVNYLTIDGLCDSIEDCPVITNIEGDITNIKGDITTIQGDITTINGDITNIKKEYLTIDGLCDSIRHNCTVAFTDERNVFTKRNRFEKVVILEKGAVQPDGTIATTDSLNSVNGKDLANYTGKVIHDSIVNKISNQIHDTVMNHLTEYEIKNCDDVKNCVAPQIKDSLNLRFVNYFNKTQTKTEIATTIHDSIVNKISNQIHDTVMNHLAEYEIKNCEDVMNCPDIKTMRDSIQINRASISNNYIRIQSNRDSIRTLAINLRDTINRTVLDSIKLSTSKINLAIDTLVENHLKQWMDIFTVSTAEQTDFTISKTPKANTLVKMYINGVMVGAYTTGMSNTVITVAGTSVTYSPANNLDACGAAYKLKAGDRVAFEYWY